MTLDYLSPLPNVYAPPVAGITPPGARNVKARVTKRCPVDRRMPDAGCKGEGRVCAYDEEFHPPPGRKNCSWYRRMKRSKKRGL